jgi:hypothetical protein
MGSHGIPRNEGELLTRFLDRVVLKFERSGARSFVKDHSEKIGEINQCHIHGRLDFNIQPAGYVL